MRSFRRGQRWLLAGIMLVLVLPVRDGAPRPVVCTTDGRPLPADVWQRALGAKALAGGALAEPIFCTWDSIPRTTTWKVRRLELRRRLEVGQFPGPGG